MRWLWVWLDLAEAGFLWLLIEAARHERVTVGVLLALALALGFLVAG